MSLSFLFPDASRLTSVSRHEVLTRALGHHDERVVPFFQPFFQIVEQAPFAVKVKRHFGDEHIVDVIGAERRVRGDESRVPAHKL